MDILQKIFEKTIKDSLSFPIVGAKLITKQLEKKGVVLTEDQIEYLKVKLENISDKSLHIDFEFDDDQIKILGISNGESIKIDIGDEKEFKEFSDEFFSNLEDFLPEIIDGVVPIIYSNFMKGVRKELRIHKKEIQGFERRLYKDWKKPFDLFEALLMIAFDAGSDFNSEFRKNIKEEDKFVLEALTRLHARACQIAYEIFVLLENGLADGAHARWRSLHEIVVVASFIKTHGNNVAERYLLHDSIESYKAAMLYQKHYKTLGTDPISQEEISSIKTVYDKLLERFGKNYKNNYGWAAVTLHKSDPNFSDIEENTGLDHLRPYYKLASHNVHANPKGIMFRMGLLDSVNNVLLAGPSNFGFTDPAHSSAFALTLITIDLLTTNPTVDNLVVCNILLKIKDEIGDEFFKVQKLIEEKSRVTDSIIRHNE